MPDPTTIAAAVSVLVLLSQVGLIAWIRWSFERMAEAAATKAETKAMGALHEHDASIHAHRAAAEHNHRGMETKLDTLTGIVMDLREDMARMIDAHNMAVQTGACPMISVRREIGGKVARGGGR